MSDRAPLTASGAAPVRARSPRWWKLVAAIAVVLGLTGGVAVWAVSRDEVRDSFLLRAPVPASAEHFALAVFQSLGARLLPGHELSLVQNGAVFDAIEAEAALARSSVHLLVYIWEPGAASDRIVKALIARARAGVACRVLVDAFGSPGFTKTVQPALSRAGCEVRVFRPSQAEDLLTRNHRKIVVFDGRVAITGGFGVRDNWLGDGVHADGWRDANVRFVGPAVAEAQQAFAENWQEAGGALLGAEAFPVPETRGSASATFVASTASPVLSRAERLTQLMIAAARKRLWIANAYFVPSKGILQLLRDKASQGVDVRILAPGKNSDSKTSFGAQRVEYRLLMERGVRVWEYLPSMMHAKTMLVDDDLALVGSINLEPLSLTQLEDAALLIQDRAFAARLADSFIADCKHASELRR